MKERFSMHFNLACLILYVPTWELKRVHLGSACAWYCVYLSSLTTDPWGSESNPCVDDQEGYHCASIHCPQRALIFALYNSYGLVVIPFRVRNNKKHPYKLVITYLPTYLPTYQCLWNNWWIVSTCILKAHSDLQQSASNYWFGWFQTSKTECYTSREHIR